MYPVVLEDVGSRAPRLTLPQYCNGSIQGTQQPMAGGTLCIAAQKGGAGVGPPVNLIRHAADAAPGSGCCQSTAKVPPSYPTRISRSRFFVWWDGEWPKFMTVAGAPAPAAPGGPSPHNAPEVAQDT
jgi:hypothetical protein